MKRILVTGAGGSASFNYVQSLIYNPQNEKFYSVGADENKYHLELANTHKKYILPRISDPHYLDKLNQLIDKEKIDFLHIQPDVEVDFISKSRDKIATKTLLPKYETIQICQDKMRFNSLMKKNKLAVPQAYQITSEASLKEGLAELLRSNEKVWLRAVKGAGSKAALPVKKLSHAKMWIDYWKTMKGLSYEDFMISEFLPGKEYAFQSFWMNGELMLSQARERIEYIFGNLTPSGQSSSPSVAMTVHNPEVNQLAVKAIKILDSKATGIFCVDMKTDKKGKVNIIEINAGRFFTTSYFFSAAGLNMPYYYTKYGLGEKVNDLLPKYNSVPEGLYWLRMIDMGYKLIKDNQWTSTKI